jgi:hypothetical protein
MTYPTHCPHCGKPIFPLSAPTGRGGALGESSETLKNNALATVAATLPRGQKWLSRVIDPQSFRREFRIGTLSDMGDWLGRYHGNGHGGRAYDKSAIYRLEQRERKPTKDVQESYAAIANALMHERYSGRVRLVFRFGPRVWRVIPVVTCSACGKDFTPERITDTQCRRCRSHR